MHYIKFFLATLIIIPLLSACMPFEKRDYINRELNDNIESSLKNVDGDIQDLEESQAKSIAAPLLLLELERFSENAFYHISQAGMAAATGSKNVSDYENVARDSINQYTKYLTVQGALTKNDENLSSEYELLFTRFLEELIVYGGKSDSDQSDIAKISSELSERGSNILLQSLTNFKKDFYNEKLTSALDDLIDSVGEVKKNDENLTQKFRVNTLNSVESFGSSQEFIVSGLMEGDPAKFPGDITVASFTYESRLARALYRNIYSFSILMRVETENLDIDSVVTELVEEDELIANMIGEAFDADTRTIFLNLWNKRSELLVQYIVSDDSVVKKETLSKLRENAIALTSSFAASNPLLTAESLDRTFFDDYEHLQKAREVYDDGNVMDHFSTSTLAQKNMQQLATIITQNAVITFDEEEQEIL